MTTTSTTKRTRKVVAGKAKVEAAAIVAEEKAPQVNPHIAAGVSLNRYSGPSTYVNSNRKVKVMVKSGVSPAKLTSRAQAGFYALRDSYAKNGFNAHGFDNGILRDLIASGLIKTTGGQKTVIDGKDYLLDGAKPLTLHITDAGHAYGKA
jgi:hypothetical protein